MAARRAHNPKVPGSSPGPATDKKTVKTVFLFKSLLRKLHKNIAPFQALFPLKTLFSYSPQDWNLLPGGYEPIKPYRNIREISYLRPHLLSDL